MLYVKMKLKTTQTAIEMNYFTILTQTCKYIYKKKSKVTIETEYCHFANFPWIKIYFIFHRKRHITLKNTQKVQNLLTFSNISWKRKKNFVTSVKQCIYLYLRNLRCYKNKKVLFKITKFKLMNREKSKVFLFLTQFKLRIMA